jgi:hypothetical protein
MKRYFVSITLFFVCGIYAYGQPDTIIRSSDIYHELWTEASASYKLNKHWRAEYTQSVRFSDKVSGYKYTFSELGIQYRFANAFAVKIKGRYVFVPDTFNIFRYYADFTYDFQRKGFPVRLDYRLRFGDSPNTANYNRETYLRNRLGISYNLSNFADPYLQYELFYSIAGTFDHEFTLQRYYAGVHWALGKHLGLDSYYFYGMEMQERTEITNKGNIKIIKPDRVHTFALELKYSF